MSKPPEDAPHALTRRSFLQGSTVAVTAAAVAPVLKTGAADNPNPTAPYTIDTPRSTITLTVNGNRHELSVEDRWTLVEVLRDELQLTGTKIGCNRSECGACTVLLDGVPVYACSQLAVWADGKSVQTVEGLAVNGRLSPLQQAFVDHNGPQCGFCTPGQLMTATALLAGNPRPDAAQVKDALVGNLCRCSNYHAIVEAVVAAGAGNAGRGTSGGDA
ncbi:MAG: hypothetical protein RLZZ385_1925 [Pseudomonadota bacterium]|jgi:aerobic-type carbon monoxide dehydrogenase small subunit (CoxS/CutS family)